MTSGSELHTLRLSRVAKTGTRREGFEESSADRGGSICSSESLDEVLSSKT